MHDIAVVGSGMGGALTAALEARDKDVILFEKEPHLGGCASTFKRGRYHYNTGATTFAGYEEGMILKSMLDQIGCKPNLLPSSPAIRVIQGENIIDRVQDFEAFLKNLEAIHPHPGNRAFWSLVYDLDKRFWEVGSFTYLKHSHTGRMQTLKSIYTIYTTFGKYLYQNARSVINHFLPNISEAYLDFIDACLLITLQAKSHEVSFVSAAIGLAYPFHPLYYPVGGMGAIFESILQDFENLHRSEQIQKIERHRDHFILHSDKSTYQSQTLVLNMPVFNAATLFDDPKIVRYYKGFKEVGKGAFVLYLKIDSDIDFHHHYQVILEETIPHTISKSFFISFSDPSDDTLSKDGYSVTISTHTDITAWQGLDKEAYTQKKENLQSYLITMFLEHFPALNRHQITKAFSATPNTFDRYILRKNAGGIALTPLNFLHYASCDTPVKNLYNVGDTIFPGQGWPGVAMGVQILQKVLHGTR